MRAELRAGDDLVLSKLAAGSVPFADASGDLDQDPLFTYSKSLGSLRVEDVNVYVPVNGNVTGFIRFGTLGSGDAVDDMHGLKVGIHWTGAGGDQPGANYGVATYAYFNGPLRIGIGGVYKFMYGANNDNTEAGHSAFGPDDHDGVAANDNYSDLGRYTLAGVGGEGYDRKQRWRDVYLAGAIRWGNKNLADHPVIDESPAGTLRLRGGLAAGSANADVYQKPQAVRTAGYLHIWDDGSGSQVVKIDFTGKLFAVAAQLTSGGAALTFSQGSIDFPAVQCQTTVGAAGGGSALPATPVKYVFVTVAGTPFKIPLYNV
jgi:hypothetical protein